MHRRGFLGVLGAASASWAIGCGTRDAGPASGGASLEDWVTQKLDEAKLPAIAAAVVKNGEVAWTKAWGFADVEHQVRATEDTSFVMGSVSKTVTGVAVLAAVESGALSLDQDVDELLPFAVRNPKWPDVPITLRMLMDHSSSIQESAPRLVKLAQPGDPTTSLRDLLEPYLVPGGATYVDGESYGAQRPGDKYVYSNFAAALAAYAAEVATGTPFAELCKQKIFAPLGMRNTSFRIADLDPANLAIQYSYDLLKGQIPGPETSVPYYPSTALRTSVKDLARFLAAITRGGEIDGVRILRKETVAEMLKQQIAAADPNNDVYGNGLLWEMRRILDRDCVGHGGSFYGASTRMHFRPEDGVGVITIANGDVHLRIVPGREEQMVAWLSVEGRLFQDA